MFYLAAIDEEIVVVDAGRERGQVGAELSSLLLVPPALYQLLSPAAPHFNLHKDTLNLPRICTFNGKESFVVISAPGQSSAPKGGNFHSWKWFTLSFLSSLRECGEKLFVDGIQTPEWPFGVTESDSVDQEVVLVGSNYHW